jgi:hypothetical protein
MSDIDELHKKRFEIIKEIEEMPLWVNGSVIESTRKQNGKEYPFYYLSQSIGGKTQTTYISAKQLDQFKTAVNNGLRVKSLMSEVSLINIKLVKLEVSND